MAEIKGQLTDNGYITLEDKLEVTDDNKVSSQVKSEVINNTEIKTKDTIEVIEKAELIAKVKSEVTDDDVIMTEVVSELTNSNEITTVVTSKLTNNTEVTEINDSEYSEFLEAKLDSTDIGSIRARKSGPGSSWLPQNNTYCGVLNCPSTTASCPDLWFFKLPLHRQEPERRQQWLEQIKRLDVQTCHRLLICERHFDSKDMGGGNLAPGKPISKKYLKRGVIPTLHLPAANKKIQSLHLTKPKHVYKRVYQNVNKTIGHAEPSTSAIESDSLMKKPKTHLETTVTQEKNPTKATIKNIKQKEKEELLLISTLCDGLGSDTIKNQIIELKHNLKNLLKFDKNRYSDECYSLIHEMYYSDPLCYQTLQNILGLPSLSAFKNFKPLSNEGLNRVCLYSLEAKLNLINPTNKDCIVCIDIVKITPHIYYDYKRDTINGVDKQIAPYRFAIVAMARGISVDWHQIVSVYFFHYITISAFNEYRSWVNSVISSLCEIEISIKAMVTSTDDFFVQAYSIKESTIHYLSSAKYYFVQKGKKILHIFDPLYLISCLYQELQDNFFIFNDNCKADWMHVKQYYLHDQEREVRFRNTSCTISDDTTKLEKMESAAGKLLNETTATGIFKFIKMGILNKEARHIANLIMILNELFKFVYLNEKSRRITHCIKTDADDKPLKLPLREARKLNNSVIEYIHEKLHFLKNLKSCGKNKNEKIIKCLVISFRSILAIIEETKIREVTSLTQASEIIRNYNLDPLVELIDKMTLKNKKPLTSKLLVKGILESLIQNEREAKINTFLKYGEKLVNLQQHYRKEPKMSIIMKDHLKYISDYSAFRSNDGNSLMFVATYLLVNMFQKFSNVVSTKIKLLNSRVICQQSSTSTNSSVIIPDDDFLQLLISMDTVIIHFCRKALLRGKWFATLQEEISKEVANNRYSSELASLDFIIDLFIHLRIYHVVKYNNSLYETDGDLHEFTVKRLEGYKLEQKKVKLPCLDYRRNPNFT